MKSKPIVVYILVYGIDQTFLGVSRVRNDLVTKAREMEIVLVDSDEYLSNKGMIIKETI
jgi:hypothetical protein